MSCTTPMLPSGRLVPAHAVRQYRASRSTSTCQYCTLRTKHVARCRDGGMVYVSTGQRVAG
eukprot:1908739-Rhodomonas_salina.3